MSLKLTFASLIFLGGAIAAAGQAPVRAPLQPVSERKPAPEFSLADANAKTATLAEYHGKVVLLDFWATWCGGCKEEIPWFDEFHKSYGAKGLAVVGVSLDEGGWKVLKPFLEEHPIRTASSLATTRCPNAMESKECRTPS